jgi:hypothetical protein
MLADTPAVVYTASRSDFLNAKFAANLQIDFSLTGRSAIEKLRARLRYKRLLKLRYTFPFKNKTQQNQAKSFFSHLPVTGNQAALKPEDVEEYVSSGSLPFSMGDDAGAILKCPDHGQLQLVTRRLVDELRQPFYTVARVRIVLHKSLVVDVLGRKGYIPGANAVKYRQNFLDVSFRHCLLSFSQVGWGLGGDGFTSLRWPQRVRRCWCRRQS